MVKTEKVLDSKTKRDIIKNFKQFVTIIIIAILAVCLFSGLIANYHVLKNRVNSVYDNSNVADLWVNTSEYDENDLPYISLIDNVKVAEKRTIVNAFYKSEAINGIVVNSYSSISVPVIIEGDEGFVIEKSFADYKKLKVGDQLTVTIAVPEQIKKSSVFYNSYVKEGASNVFVQEYLDLQFEITGIMRHSESLSNAKVSTSYFYTNKETYDNAYSTLIENNFLNSLKTLMFQTIIKNLNISKQIVVKLNSEKNIKDVKTKINEYYNNKDNNNFISCLDIESLETNADIMSDIRQSKQMTLVFPLIFFLVAFLIIVTTISQITIREKTQIGVMKAIGVKNSTIINHYIRLTVALCSIGFVIGMIIGPLLLPNVMNRKYAMLFSLPKINYVFPLLELILCYSVFCGIAGLISYLICKNEINKLPVESMKAASPQTQKKLLIEQMKKKPKLSMPTIMALRNIKVKTSRSIMVIIGIIGCMALLLCGFGIDDTLKNGVSNDIDNLYYSDINISYTELGVHDELDNVEGIDFYENYTILPVTIQGDKSFQTNIKIIDDNSRIFKVEYDKNKIALSSKVSKEIGANVGSIVSFNMFGNQYSEEVGTIFDAFYYHGIVVPYSRYEQFGNNKNMAWVMVDEGFNNEVNENIKSISTISNSVTNEEFNQQINDSLSSISLMTTTLKVFAILLAVVVLYNIALLNYKERQRDIATLKVLGFNKKEISKSLIIEIMILTILGAFIGMIFGMPMVKLVLSINETPVVNFLYKLTFLSYIKSLLITIGTSYLINVCLTNLTNKVQMVESLKSYD